MRAKHKPLTYISLFAGCGGFDLGFKGNGFKNLGAYDIDPAVVAVHRDNIGHPIYSHDLNDRNLPGNLPKQIDVVIAGSPCQGFSTIGKRIINDPRNNLLLVGGEIAVKYQAKVFVCENVPGSTAGEHGNYWKQLLELLKENGYTAKLVKYNVAELGVPQSRTRLILYAWKTSLKIADVNFHDYQKKSTRLRNVLTKDLLKAPNHNLNFITDNDHLVIASRIGPGQKLCNVRGGPRSIHTWDIPEVFGKVTKSERHLLESVMKLRRQIRRRANGDADPVEVAILKEKFNGQTSNLINSLVDKGYLKTIDGGYVELKNTFNGKYKRLDIGRISPTVDTRFGNYKNFLHPHENRSLSVREAARIQGFDDSFVFKGSIQKQYEMVGNAVPPPLAAFVANTVRAKILFR